MNDFKNCRAVAQGGLESALEMGLSVEDVGVFKPHPKVYGLASQGHDPAPEKICFASANGWGAAGADAFGFAAVWLDPRSEPEDRLPGRPRTRITTLGDLPALLGVAS